MKLFNSDTVESYKNRTDNSSSECMPVIVSHRSEILNDIQESLRLYNIDNTEVVLEDVFNLPLIPLSQDSDTFIIDIEKCSDLSKIKQVISLLIPVHANCILIGDNDSISFGKNVGKLGVYYFHFSSQLTELPRIISKKSVEMPIRDSMIFSVLGCKGGCGTSSFCFELLKATGKASSIPQIMIQGASGSEDLDFIMGKAIPKNSILQVDKNISVKIEDKDNAWNYKDLDINNYNIAFIDNSIYNCNQEQLDYVIKSSHSLLLVITPNFSSLRVAKFFIDHLSRSGLIETRFDAPRVFICLNHIQPEARSELSIEDIEKYLGCKINIIIPYNQSFGRTKDAKSKSINDFVMTLLGRKKQHEKLNVKSLSRLIPFIKK